MSETVHATSVELTNEMVMQSAENFAIARIFENILKGAESDDDDNATADVADVLVDKAISLKLAQAITGFGE